MKVRNIQSGINFGRSLQNEEIKEFTSVRDEAKKLAGQTGRSILIVHDACLPQSPEKNTGVGNLTSEESMKFFDMMKTYLGINEVKVLPQNQTYGVKGTYIAYGGDSTALGNHVINTYLLTTPEYAAILKKDEFDSVVRYNSGSLNDKLVNYENVVDSNSPNERALKKAHERFKRLTEENSARRKKAISGSIRKGLLHTSSISSGSMFPMRMPRNI